MTIHAYRLFIPVVILLYLLVLYAIHWKLPGSTRHLLLTSYKQTQDSSEVLEPEQAVLEQPQQETACGKRGKGKCEQPHLPLLPSCRDNIHMLNHVSFQRIRETFLYTGYYDNRERGRPPFVRIFSLANEYRRIPLYCHFETSAIDGMVYVTSHIQYYEMCENHGKRYGGFILSCPVPRRLRETPCHVIVSMHKDLKTRRRVGNVALPLFALQGALPSRFHARLGLCVSPLFGYIQTAALVEFIETSLDLGVEHVVFYAADIPQRVSDIIEFYRRRGVVTVVRWAVPVAQVWYHAQLLALNDCLYRNMNRFRLILFNDIDEFLVPHKHSNLSSMLNDLELAPAKNVSGFVFRSAFFDPSFIYETTESYDLGSDLRTKTFSKVRSKVIVYPKRVFEVGIHHVSKPLRHISPPISVSPKVGFIHHYRACVTTFDPKVDCQQFTRDQTLLPRVPRLRTRVNEVLIQLSAIANKTKKTLS